MKKILSIILLFIFGVLINGCASADSSPSYDLKGGYGEMGEFGYFENSEEIPTGESKKNIAQNLFRGVLDKKAGMLTASLVDDNENFDFWKKLILTDNEQSQTSFNDFNKKFNFNTDNRIKLEIKNVNSAFVRILDEEGEEEFASSTDALGNVYLFPTTKRSEYKVQISYPTRSGIDSITRVVKDNDVIDIQNVLPKEDKIELMFVVDTTGSMSDELSFLQLELEDVISKVQKENPNTDISIALLFYRDKDDEYVTKYFDFSTDINLQKNNLAEQMARGGGDFEEAVYLAFRKASEKQWSSSATTKILVHVADAPSHDKDVPYWKAAINALAEKGVKIVTVASSGINKKTEYFFRSQSLLTGGKYIYLTDDSGIGNTHIEATVEEKPVVEYLNALLVRVINGYHTGDFKEAVPYYEDVNTNPLPEKMPDDFSFKIEWNKDLTDNFDSKSGELKTTIDENGQIATNTETVVLTITQLEHIYDVLRVVNYAKITSDVENPVNNGLKVTLNCNGETHVYYFGTTSEVYHFQNGASYGLYLRVRSILSALDNQIK